MSQKIILATLFITSFFLIYFNDKNNRPNSTPEINNKKTSILENSTIDEKLSNNDIHKNSIKKKKGPTSNRDKTISAHHTFEIDIHKMAPPFRSLAPILLHFHQEIESTLNKIESTHGIFCKKILGLRPGLVGWHNAEEDPFQQWMYGVPCWENGEIKSNKETEDSPYIVWFNFNSEKSKHELIDFDLVYLPGLSQEK